MENIHIRVGHPEALESKKNILLSEKELLELVKKIKAYSLLRKKEFTLKNKIKKDLAGVRTLIKTIDDEMPNDEELRIPKTKPIKSKEGVIGLEEAKGKLQKKKKGKKSTKRKSKKSAIDQEIYDIEEKLASLG